MSLEDAAGLIDAAMRGDITAVRNALEKGIDVNARGTIGMTALMHASKHGHTETAKMLIEKGSNINVKSEYGYTALLWASINGHTETEKFLLHRRKTYRQDCINDCFRKGIHRNSNLKL